MYILLTKREVKDGWILVEFSFCVFMDRDEVEVNKNAKRERGQYPAILTELAWSIKDLLYGIKSTEKNDLRTWRNFICGNETGSPGRAVSLHLARSGSQSEHRIRRILPARGACHINSLINFVSVFIYIVHSR